MAGYKLQGQTTAGETVVVPLAAETDSVGNKIIDTYATKTELELLDNKLENLEYCPTSGVSLEAIDYLSGGEIDAALKGKLSVTGGSLTGVLYGDTDLGGLVIKSTAKGASSNREGIYVLTADNGYATIALGESDRSHMLGLVCSTAENAMRFDVKKSTDSEIYQINIPTGKNGTIALTNDFYHHTIMVLSSYSATGDQGDQNDTILTFGITSLYSEKYSASTLYNAFKQSDGYAYFPASGEFYSTNWIRYNANVTRLSSGGSFSVLTYINTESGVNYGWTTIASGHVFADHVSKL